MRSAALESVEFTPVFDWAAPRSRRLSLISFIAASAALHALCFYIFQIIYPPTVALLPPPARVQLIAPNSEEGRVLLRWIEAEDPALSSITQRPPDAVVLQPPHPAHVPSFAGREPPLRQLPRYEPDLRVPSAHPPGPVVLPRVTVAPEKIKVATQVTFAAAEELGPPALPAANFNSSRNDPPQAAQFRVAVNAEGEVRHCFLETSSDDPALDEQGRRYLLLCRFPANRIKTSVARDLIWTTATIEWGNDFGPEKPAP